MSDYEGAYLTRREIAAQQDSPLARALQRREKVQEVEAAPTPAPQAAAPKQEEGGSTIGKVASDIGKGIADAPRQIIGGARDAFQEAFEAVESFENWMAEKGVNMPSLQIKDADGNFDLGISSVKERIDSGRRGLQLPEVDEADSVTGDVIRNASQFLTGFAGGMTALKGVTAASTAGKLAKAGGAGAISDAFAFDPHEARLSNLVQSVPSLENPVNEYLAASPEDGEVEGRFKNALEGAGLGLMTEGVFQAVRLLRTGRQARAGAEGAQEGAEETAVTALPAAQPGGRQTGARTTVRPIDNPDDFTLDLSGGNEERAFNINLARVDAPEDIRGMISRTARHFRDDIDEARRGTQSNELTAALADDLGMTAENLLARRQGQAFNAEEALAARNILVSSADNLTQMAKRIAGTADTTETDLVNFRRALAVHKAIQEQVSGFTAEAGRALQSFRISSRGQQEQLRNIRDLIDAGGGDQMIRDMADGLAQMETPRQINRYVRDVSDAKTPAMLYEAWINGLLSGPQTHAVNITSNMLTAAWSIPERFLAGQIGRLSGGGGVATGEGASMAYGMARGALDGLKMAAEAFRTEGLADPITKVEMPFRRAITAANLSETIPGKAVINPTLKMMGAKKLDEGGMAARFVDGLGTVVRFPGTRMLATEDAFFKGLNYRMELHAQAHRQATGEGLEGRELAERIHQIMENPPENIRLNAIDHAATNTFTSPNRVASAVTGFLRRAPAARIIIPFVRTPSNIIKYTFERTPLAPLARYVREDIAAGGTRRDLALAKISMGSMTMMGASAMASAGLITGGGPSDRELQNNLRRTGWQPYSIKIGDTYYAYNRLDPVAMFLGLAADYTDIAGQADELDVEELAAAIGIAFSKNVMNKTWLTGIADVMAAMEDPDRFGNRYLSRQAGSVVPNVLAQTNRTFFDPTLREVDSMMDAIKSRIPGYSKELPPRRDLWGEPIVLGGGLGPDIISPLYMSKEKDSPVDREMIEHGVEVSMPTRSIKGAELTPEEYSKLVELAGRPAKKALEEIIKSSSYKRGTDGADGSKAETIKRVVSAYRQAARAQMMKDSPDLQQRILEAQGIEVEE